MNRSQQMSRIQIICRIKTPSVRDIMEQAQQYRSEQQRSFSPKVKSSTTQQQLLRDFQFNIFGISNSETVSRHIVYLKNPIKGRLIENYFKSEADLHKLCTLYAEDKYYIYTFDRIFGHQSTNEQMYTECIQELLNEQLNERCATIIIAGSDQQTKNVLVKGDDTKEKDLLNFTELSKKSKKSHKKNMEVQVSIYLIYQNTLIDLLGDKLSTRELEIEKITKGKSTFDAIKKCKIESLDEFKNINRLASSNAKLLFDKYSNILLNESSHIVTSITLKRIKRIDSKELETSTVINFVRLCDVDRLLKDNWKELSELSKSLQELAVTQYAPPSSTLLQHVLKDSMQGDSRVLVIGGLSGQQQYIQQSKQILNYLSDIYSNIKRNNIIRQQYSNNEIQRILREVDVLYEELNAHREKVQDLVQEEYKKWINKKLENYQELLKQFNKIPQIYQDYMQYQYKLDKILQTLNQMQENMYLQKTQKIVKNDSTLPINIINKYKPNMIQEDEEEVYIKGEGESASLQKKMAHLKFQKKELKRQIRELSDTLIDRDQLIEQQAQQIHNLQQKKGTQNEEQRDFRDELYIQQRKNEELQRENGMLKVQLAESKVSIQGEKENEVINQQENQKKQGLLEELKENLKQQQNIINDLKETLEKEIQNKQQIDYYYNLLQKETNNLKYENQMLNDKLIRNQKRYDDIQSRIKQEFQSEIDAVNDKYQNIKKDYDLLNNKFNNLQNELFQYQADKDQTQRSLKNQDDELNFLRKNIQEIENYNNKLNSENYELQQQLDSLKQEVFGYQEKIKILESENIQLNNIISGLEDKNIMLEREAQVDFQTIKSLQKEKKELIEQCQNLNEQIIESKQQMKTLEQQQNDEITQFEEKLEDFFEELKKTKHENQNLKQQQTKIQNQLAEVTQQREKYKESFDNAKQTNRNLKMYVSEIEKKFQEFLFERESQHNPSSIINSNQMGILQPIKNQSTTQLDSKKNKLKVIADIQGMIKKFKMNSSLESPDEK